MTYSRCIISNCINLYLVFTKQEWVQTSLSLDTSSISHENIFLANTVWWSRTAEKPGFLKGCFEACCHVVSRLEREKSEGRTSKLQSLTVIHGDTCQSRKTHWSIPLFKLRYLLNRTTKWHIDIAPSIYYSHVLWSSLIEQRCGLAGRKGKDGGGVAGWSSSWGRLLWCVRSFRLDGGLMWVWKSGKFN